VATQSSSTSKLRILIFNWRDLAHPLAGGAEVYTHRVAEEWIKMGHEVTLFCSSVAGEPERENLNGLKIIRRGGKHSVYREAKKYYKLEGRGKYDLVIDEVNTRPFGAPKWVNDAQVIALIHQVCREVWFHQVSILVALLGRFFLEPYWLRAYRDTNVVTLSSSSKKSLELYGLLNVRIVPVGFENRINLSKIEKSEKPTIIFVGRLSSNKRPDHAIKAFRHLQRKIPDAKLLIIGSGPMSKKLSRHAHSGVEMLGRVANDERDFLIASSHVLVITSVREGWGMVVTEAAAVGTASVGYEVDGIRDSVSSANGFLCDPDPRALGDSLAQYFHMLNEKCLTPPSVSGVLPWDVVAKELLNFDSKG